MSARLRGRTAVITGAGRGIGKAMAVALAAEGARVALNGRTVAEHAGDPRRPKAGPIGLQMHDQFSLIMFRNIRIREIGTR